jgi:hypothetical protein
MSGTFDLLADYADAQFDGESYDGASLMATLDSLDATRAAADSSHEGYSAWSVVLHLAYCKHVVARSIASAAGGDELAAYPYPEGIGGFYAPLDASEAGWAECRAYLRRIHRIAMLAIREQAAELTDRIIPEWKIPVDKAVVWLCGHDTYHTAQIRNMGVPGLKAKRVYGA